MAGQDGLLQGLVALGFAQGISFCHLVGLSTALHRLLNFSSLFFLKDYFIVL